MTDIMIRNVNEDDLARLDEKANRRGLSRAEFVRRTLHDAATAEEPQVTRADWERASAIMADLRDPEFVRRMHKLDR